MVEGSTAVYGVAFVDGDNPGTVTINWEVQVTGSGPGHADASDFAANAMTGQATFTGNSPVVRVATRDDGMPDGIETFRVRVTSWQGVASTGSDVVPGVIVPQGQRDYDADGDGLIDVTTTTQLNAMRYDEGGAGLVGVGTAVEPFPGAGLGRIGVSVDVADVRAYESAFPFFSQSMTCPTTNTCGGYELLNGLDFNTGDAAIRSDDLYWNGGRGWEPVNYAATFDGNGHVISNLYIDNSVAGRAPHGSVRRVERGRRDQGVGSGGRARGVCGMAGRRLGGLDLRGHDDYIELRHGWYGDGVRGAWGAWWASMRG